MRDLLTIAGNTAGCGPSLQRLMAEVATCRRGWVARGAALTQGTVLLMAAVVLAADITVWTMRQDALEATQANTENLATVSSSMPQQAFTGLYAPIDLPQHESLMLLHRDGMVLVVMAAA